MPADPPIRGTTRLAGVIGILFIVIHTIRSVGALTKNERAIDLSMRVLERL